MAWIIGAVFMLFFIGLPVGLMVWLLVAAARRATVCVGQCSRCGYDLRQLGGAHQCPECGHPFSIDDQGRVVSRYWIRQHSR